ncbi:type III polyketide synthase [Microbacterium xanthum]|uniref:type III polyketide synthase n=1 Tax=Microbacterium xanthum TaxID=3079794 RepID=UPI002AD2FEFB|nr:MULTISPECIES: 3-oxoacyl-[acyl-carrier-protein] synthase III C-terminal domain-containing protein [unclassified Microbacterium]MDZ8172971.1 3-oxoacyl-[acyl-carrier-protein] synthase III C-terminal domain-containing protein [Microbacterium sp. KSW-48]MDZ8200869.1 3-oxoacyl-[acyl-carrier-protein] synthase III C-terminal domain-containing protein [Microbacterium sp. SSW1-59]
MAPRIVAIGTTVPPVRLAQNDVRDMFTAQPGTTRLTQRLIHAAFDAADIQTRHSVVSQLATAGDPAPGDVLFRDAAGTLHAPGTGARNDLYIREAPGLYAAAARAALRDAEVAPAEVTHVITVSCTGFFAPGPDYRLVRDLGIRREAERYHLGFIGCAAALPAIRAAERIARADPDAVVLVASAELCSLHIRVSNDPQQIVAASVFGDGAAAAVITGDPAAGRPGGLELDGFATTLTTEGETDMTWTIGDHGFDMILSADVPRIIGREIRDAIGPLLHSVDAWAVHPGGRSVLDRVESGLGLDAAALTLSRHVLRTHGNMSSATLLFILREILHGDLADGAAVGALAFGPGLTVESARMTKRTHP